ncbi:hypothetical protein X777_04297, partial [Ooceraea biroi]
RFGEMEENVIYAIATMLDPRFKKVPFQSSQSIKSTKEKIVAECKDRNESRTSNTEMETINQLVKHDNELWKHFENKMKKMNKISNPTSMSCEYELKNESIFRILKRFKLNVTYLVNNNLECVIKHGKDRLTHDCRTDVVYRINCANCEACYIGQTKRHLNTRIKEHISDVRKCESNWSMVSKHRVNCGHEFNWSNVDVLHQETQLRKRLIAEMVFIKRHKLSINLQKDTENLPDIYDIVLTNM